MQEDSNPDLIAKTSQVAVAFLARNKVSATEVPSMLMMIYGAFFDASAERPPTPGPSPSPAVSIRRSITPDFLISLEDGVGYKSLKRHLRVRYGMSPDEYRAKWGLPPDYPMVAPNFRQTRSRLAKKSGLGGRHPTKRPPSASA